MIPGLGFRSETIMPTNSLRWVSSQPTNVLSSLDAMADMDQAKYNSHRKYVVDSWKGNLVQQEMISVLENLMAASGDELKYAFDSRFGTGSEWKEFIAMKTMKLVIAQTSSRFTVGLPLCKKFRRCSQLSDILNSYKPERGLAHRRYRIWRFIYQWSWHDWNDACIIKATPLSYYYLTHSISSMENETSLQALFGQCMDLIQDAESDKTQDPKDHIHMMFRFAKTKRPEELNLKDTTHRLAMANLGSFHQAGIALTNAVLNIVGSDAEYNTVSKLREEFSSVLAAHENKWSKAAIAQMIRTDSVLRETHRLNSFGGRSVIRKVMVSGLTAEDDIVLPKGAHISLLSHSPQTDEQAFEDPHSFDRFRFSRLREETLGG